MIQTSCSELLVDTKITSPKLALEKFTKLFKKVGWESSPPLSLELLKEVRDKEGDYDNKPEVVVYDSEGNRVYLGFGGNGYITTGYRFDSQCNHVDSTCYPIFKKAIEELEGELIACDGGSKGSYEEWEGGNEDNND